jgi:ATP-dependent Clp protease ATP-binding subunit ClpC
MEVRTHIRIMKQSALTSEARGFSRRDVDMVTENDVADVVSNWTGIPVTKITGSESERLLKMEDTIHERIIGQKHAVIAVSKAIRRARVGLTKSKSTYCKFYFCRTNWCRKNGINKSTIRLYVR